MNNIIQTLSAYNTTGLFMPVMIIGSFIAGIIASLSPCSLGILPLIIGYIGGYSTERNKRLLIQLLSFSVGLSFVLSIIGIFCAITGIAFTTVASPIIILIFASIILILGLNLLGIIDINFPTIIKKMPKNEKGGLFIFPFLVGSAFALVSSPCSSPLLISIMALATVTKNIFFSICLLFAFALGQCVIIVLAAMFTSKLKNISAFAKYSAILMKISGILLILTSFYIYYAIFSNIN